MSHDRKIDPSLSTAFDRWRVVKGGPESFSPAAATDGAPELERGDEEEVFITFEGDHRRFKDYGVFVRAVAGNIATASVSPRGLDALASDRDVLYVEKSQSLGVGPQSMNGEARAAFHWMKEIGAPDLQATLAGDASQTPVIVGVVDTHDIDVLHPDFIKDDGTTRIFSIWDQTRERDGLRTSLGYGSEYNSQFINSELSEPGRVMECRGGHGTAVAGIAAGRTGVAPRAGILFVKTTESGARALSSTAKLADALHYIFEKADESKKPCVVCMSLGDTLGPHDGTSPVERFIDNLLSKPGRAVCVSVGNYTPGKNTMKKHISGVAGPSCAAEIAFDVPAHTVSAETIEIWYPGDDEIEITIVAPGGPDMLNTTTAIHADNGVRLYDLAGSTTVAVGAVRRYPPNGENHFRLELFPKHRNGSICEGRWRIELSWRCVVDGAFDAWIDSNTKIQWVDDGRLDRITVLSPATSRFAMTVGSYGSDGGVEPTSGFGPTRDGRLKPDITALGTVEAASAGTARYYEAKYGTSVAAPQVAGAIALLFQLYGPYLCMEDAKRLLGALADKTGISGPDNHLGNGRLRLAEASFWAQARRGEVWLPKHERDSGGVPYVGPAPWASPCIDVSSNLTLEGEHDVTVRPRWEKGGPGAARVRLFWSDGASYVADDRWRSDGVFADGVHTNVCEVSPSKDAVFRVRPNRARRLGAPARLFNVRACVEVKDQEPRTLGPHPLGRYQNNVAVRSVYRASSGDVVLGFWLTLPSDESDLRFDASDLQGSKVTLRLPIGVIDLNAFPVFARALGTTFEEVPFEEHISLSARATIAEVLKGEEIIVREPAILRAAGIEGVSEVVIAGTYTDLVMRPDEHGVLRATVDRLRGAPGSLSPARLIVEGAKLSRGDGKGTHVDMAQLARGAPIGGFRIEFRAAEGPRAATATSNQTA